MRSAIMLLQNVRYIDNSKITVNDIIEISGEIPEQVINEIQNVCIINKSSCKDIMILTKKIHLDGHCITNIIRSINLMVIYNKLLSDKQKSLLCYNIATVEKRLIDGADEYLQLLYVLSNIYIICKKND
jgi:replication factor C subunit 2/4